MRPQTKTVWTVRAKGPCKWFFASHLLFLKLHCPQKKYPAPSTYMQQDIASPLGNFAAQFVQLQGEWFCLTKLGDKSFLLERLLGLIWFSNSQNVISVRCVTGPRDFFGRAEDHSEVERDEFVVSGADQSPNGKSWLEVYNAADPKHPTIRKVVFDLE